ncbi:OLC1v1002976C1 [Oldenlandia corymbosa var. corymbosa]|uniref:OLC1v1002976C1 n=1 Tax=Oldenlandia corymbosa var. corymbosa TaxID=529605 RepID=A0AAV1D9S5_OLDCO|nr:OLC1v1002976C1 [Oldenlandia corymbosa var. corymbosa]
MVLIRVFFWVVILKKSVLANLIQEIEPLDVSLIQKDVAANTVDAMKRTISGMLGLLPSDQFQVYIEALWEPLSKLLISSMMTGYTLRNAEYRLCLEKNLEIFDKNFDKEDSQHSKIESEETLVSNSKTIVDSRPNRLIVPETTSETVPELPDFGEMTPETRQYIINLQSRLLSVKRELREVKRKSGALQMQQFVGEEKNDLLDYLRSLQPEKVNIRIHQRCMIHVMILCHPFLWNNSACQLEVLNADLCRGF